MGASSTETGALDAIALRVFGGGEADFYGNCTLVMGARDAVLVDVPFTRSQAHRIVAEILDLGRDLTHIWITHSHPDHYFGAGVFLEAFPNAELVALPRVSMNVGMSVPGRLNAWAGMLGPNGPGNPLVPKPYDRDRIELEGHTLHVLGPVAGDHPDSSCIHVPSVDAVIAGDVVFDGFHLFMAHATEDDRHAWAETVERLRSLHPATVVPGHRAPNAPTDSDPLQYTADYLAAFNTAAESAETSDDIVAAMERQFPDAADIMQGFVLTASAQVAAGEMEPVPETESMDD